MSGPGPVALVGSGEWLPAMLDVEARLLAGRPARYVQVPTAAAPEGEAVLQRWVSLGREQAARLGVEAVPLVARDRREADDEELAAQVAGAGLVYLSGGDPAHLAATLRGTRLWSALLDAWRAGAALAGCSAGAMALGGLVPHVREPGAPEPGLGVVPSVRVLPHFDRLVHLRPELVGVVAQGLPAGHVVLGVDELTAVVHRDGAWRVEGRGMAHLVAPAGGEHAAGAVLDLPEPLA